MLELFKLIHRKLFPVPQNQTSEVHCDTVVSVVYHMRAVEDHQVVTASQSESSFHTLRESVLAPL